MHWLAFPCRWGIKTYRRRSRFIWECLISGDLVSLFGSRRSAQALSRIFLDTIKRLMNRWGKLLDFNPAHFRHRLNQWARVIAEKGVDPTFNRTFSLLSIAPFAKFAAHLRRIHLPPV